MSEVPQNHKKPQMSEEDDPQRVAFLADLEARKGREPFTWREVLSKSAPCYERLNPVPMRPRRRK